MLVRAEVYFTATKPDSLHLKPKALLRTRFKTKLDLTTRPYYPLPGK
jgi:hypothetical protein